MPRGRKVLPLTDIPVLFVGEVQGKRIHNLIGVPYVSQRIEIVGYSWASEGKLPPVIPPMQETRQDTHQVYSAPGGQNVQFAASEKYDHQVSSHSGVWNGIDGPLACSNAFHSH